MNRKIKRNKALNTDFTHVKNDLRDWGDAQLIKHEDPRSDPQSTFRALGQGVPACAAGGP